MAALQVHGLSAITALTAQSTTEVRDVFPVPAAFVATQLDTLTDDFTIDAAKTGMIADPDAIEVVRERAARWGWRLVVDPVMVAATGARLVSDAVVERLASLFALATVVTPNLDEVEVLVGWRPIDPDGMERAGRELLARGSRAVLVKGGHLDGEPTDVWVDREGAVRRSAPRIPGRVGHGTGCTYASSLAAWLARGSEPREAFERAHRFVHRALAQAPQGLGHGAQPLHPLHAYFDGLAPAVDDGSDPA
jgi:hydroxymethylpyrimidine/phosphomethylpyrimidine kinase